MCVNKFPRFALGSAADGIRTRDLLIASPSPKPSLGHGVTQVVCTEEVYKITRLDYATTIMMISLSG